MKNGRERIVADEKKARSPFRDVSGILRWVIGTIIGLAALFLAALSCPEEYRTLALCIVGACVLLIMFSTIRWRWLLILAPLAVILWCLANLSGEPSPFEKLEPGDVVLFGHYTQEVGMEKEIEWLVLDRQDDRLLLLSRKALESRPYHNVNTAVTWEYSDLRKWLNGTFFKEAFSESEARYICLVETEEGVRDRAFVLSQAEVEHYLPTDESRLCEATAHAVQQEAYVNSKTNGSWWLLRTPVKDGWKVVSVDSDGAMDYDGGAVASLRGTVRPAIWVSVGKPDISSFLKAFLQK